MNDEQTRADQVVGLIRRGGGLVLGLCAILSTPALAQAPANPFDYTRTVKFGYEPSTGRLSTTTVEPDIAALCSTTTHGYDAHGNIKTQDIANCAGSAGRAKFAARRIETFFDAVPSLPVRVNGVTVSVAVPAGTAATRTDNALSHSVHSVSDPRFGVATRVEDANGITSLHQLDDFGRETRVTAADGTALVTQYCILASSGADLSSNSAGCPVVPAQEAPADAKSFVHAEPRNTQDVKSGAFMRTYLDAHGRTIRVVSESFDGSSQTAGRSSAAIASDTVFDQYGMVVLQTSRFFLSSGSASTVGSNDVVVKRTDYDTLARPIRVFEANSNGGSTALFGGAGTAVTYGSYGSRKASLHSFSYSGLTTIVGDDKGREKTIQRDALGQETRVTDPLGAQAAKLFDAFGMLVQTKDALQNSIAISYDILGRRLFVNDPDKGATQYCYDAIGQLKASQNSKMRGHHRLSDCPDKEDVASGDPASIPSWNSFAYDSLGRLTKQISPSDTFYWGYDSGTGAKGRMSQSRTASGVTKAFYYDTFGRPLSSTVSISAGPKFASAIVYDAKSGRVNSKVYPTGFKVGYSYTELGYLSALTAESALKLSPLPGAPGGAAPAPLTIAAGQALWSAQVLGADGRLERSKLGSGVVVNNSYDGLGRWDSQEAVSSGGSVLLSRTYEWDSLSNLSRRIDFVGSGSGAVLETFGYDELNRLKRYSVGAPSITGSKREIEMQHNALGMMLSKSDVGNYSYGNQTCGEVRPHAAAKVAGNSRCYDLNGNLVSANGGKYRTLTYSEHDKVLSAVGPGASYIWSYDAEGMRIKEQRTQGATTRTTWYLHPDAIGGLGFERETNNLVNEARNDNRHFLEVGGATVGVVVSSGPLPALGEQTAPAALAELAAKKLEYWHKDHLGSLVATTDHAGNVTQRYAYDPYGKRRHTDGNYDAYGNLVVAWSPDVNKGTARGFTGHEELDDIGLINMNGRIYDDHVGLFLQGDPVIKDLSNTQGYNRYAYVLNNPLNLVDPSGFTEEPPKQLDRVVVERVRSEYTYVWLPLSSRRTGDGSHDYALEHVANDRKPQAVAAFGVDGLGMKGVLVLVDPAGNIVGVAGLKGQWNPSKVKRTVAKLVEQVRGLAAETGISEAWSQAIQSAKLGAASTAGYLAEEIDDFQRSGLGHTLQGVLPAEGVAAGGLKAGLLWVARLGKAEALAAKGMRWKLGPNDLDFRGSGKGVRDALDTAFERTGLPRSEFDVTRWGRDANGKSFPAEWRHKSGAEVNVDWAHAKNGPDVPHVGFQTGGKRGDGGASRGHILLDDVPFNR